MINMKEVLQDYQNKLIEKGYRPITANGYRKQLKKYFDWCDMNQKNPNTTTLDDLYDYKRSLINQKLKHQTVRQLITCIKHYFQIIAREENPALLVKHKSKEVRLPSNLFTEEALDNIYRETTIQTLIQRRDKVMLGLVIYQALKREEINRLTVHHIDIDKGCVYVPATAKTNSRTIDLSPKQMGHLMSYIYEYRPKLKELANKETEKLFFTMGKGRCFNNALSIKTQELKREFSTFKSLTQIKESRMSIWVKEHGIRKAQYLSGIKYASSMMRYKQSDVEALRKKLAIIHPMERL